MLEEKVRLIAQTMNAHRVRLHLHPFVAAYLTKGIASLKVKWQAKYRMWINIIPNQQLAYLQYQFYDSNGEEIDVRQLGEMN